MFVFHALRSVLAALLFAGMGIAAKILLVHFHPSVVVFFRFAASTLMLLPFVSWAEMRQVTRRQAMYFLFLGFMGIFLYNVLYFAALQYSSVISVSLIGAINPLVTLMLTAALARRVPSVEQLIAFVLAFMGVTLVIMQGFLQVDAFSRGLGDMLALLAVLCQISFALLVKKLGTPFSAITRTFLTGASGLIFLLPFCVMHEFWWVMPQLTVAAWCAFAYTALFGGALVTLLYVGSIHRLGAPLANLLLFSLVPVFTIPLSMVLLHKSPSGWQLAGGVLVVCALFFGLHHARKQELGA